MTTTFTLTHEDDLGPDMPAPASIVDRAVRKVWGTNQRAGWRLVLGEHFIAATTDVWDTERAHEWASDQVFATGGGHVRWVVEGDRWKSEVKV